MQKRSMRQERVNQVIHQHLSEILLRELFLKSGVLLTVVTVDVTPDLRRVAVRVNVFPEMEQEYVMGLLEHEIYHIQGHLNQKLHIHPLPRIQFVLSAQASRAQVVEDTLRQIHEEDNKEGKG